MTPKNRYIPDRGDLVYLDFDPTQGHEQRGHRPAFVLSPRSYNAKSSLALFMPVTKQQKGYPFEVLLPSGLQIQGVILVDQIKCRSVASPFNGEGSQQLLVTQPRNHVHPSTSRP